MPQPASFLEFSDLAALSLEWGFGMEEFPEIDA
jgi:hypothetical protein